jgi:hypothetical protein
LDTVARCYYELGKLEKAITWQRLAVEHNNGHRGIDAALERYLTEKSQAEQTGSSEEFAPDETESDKESPKQQSESDTPLHDSVIQSGA